MSWIRTACPRNCYSTCSLQVEVSEGRVRRMRPDPLNPATAGGPCLKGLAHLERIVSTDRLLHPLERNTSGGFDRISWERALDVVAGQLDRIRDQPQALLAYSGSGAKGLLGGISTTLWSLLGGYTTTHGDLCWPAGLEATRLTLGDNRHSAPWDLANARLIVLWGKNPAETNIHQMDHIHSALERGARLVVVDPRRTESAESCDLLVRPRPGSDGALALGVARVLLAEDLVDHELIAPHVHGLDAYTEMVREYPPERASELTGVPAPTIVELARLIGGTRPMTICAGFGMQRYTNSGQTMRALIALVALTGNLGRPGGGWCYANLQSHIFSPTRDPLAFYPGQDPSGRVRDSVSVARLGRDIQAQRDPPIRMAWIERGNPVCQCPGTGQVLQALRGLELVVVVDQLLTDTAREAHIVLPAACFLEQTDVITAYWHPYIQLTPKVVEPPGEARTHLEICRALAGHLGLGNDEVDQVMPATDDASIEAWLNERLIQTGTGLDLDDLRAGPALPPGHQEVAWQDLRFPTPSGKVELESTQAHQRWGADPLPRWTPPVEAWGADPAHPLVLLTPNTKNRIHSQLATLPTLRELEPEPILHLAPADAAARALRSGDRARVYNRRGSLELRVQIDGSLLQGCAWITNGWWMRDGGAVNLLSEARETDMGHGAAFHDTLVEVSRLEPAVGARRRQGA